jgi:hypothetical protein
MNRINLKHVRSKFRRKIQNDLRYEQDGIYSNFFKITWDIPAISTKTEWILHLFRWEKKKRIINIYEKKVVSDALTNN